MDRAWGTVRTTSGELAVERDALHLQTSPREAVAGYRARVRAGTTKQRLSAAWSILGMALLPLAVAVRLTTAAGSADLAVVLPGLLTSLSTLQFWDRYVRDTRIPRRAVEELALDPKYRELTVKHSYRDSRLPTLASPPYTTTFELPADDDVRDLRTLLRSVGYDDELVVVGDDPVAPEPVPCANCETLLSPNAGYCPSCESVLGALRAGARETSDPGDAGS